MRKFKFRAWNKKEKIMIYPGRALTHYLAIKLDGAIIHYGNDEDHTKDFILMQYTGLKDKNGKMIFEGDVVKYTRFKMYTPELPFHGKDLIHYSTVYWDDEYRSFRETGKFETGGGWAGSLHFNDSRAKRQEIEVIGNIYDNPELAKKKTP